MRIGYKVPQMEEMPLTETDEMLARKDPSHLIRLYNSWYQSCYLYEVLVLDVPAEKVVDLREKVVSRVHDERCFQAIRMHEGFVDVRIKNLCRSEVGCVTDELMLIV